MNKLIHGLIAVSFAFACLCLWGMLTLTSNTMLRMQAQPPAFTQFCIGLRPLFVVLPIMVAAYCLYVWIRKTDLLQRPWMPFFAATMGCLVVVTLPTMMAAWLPVIQFIGVIGK